MALILYVDDEYANRVVFEYSFKNRFTVKCVSSALEAFEVLKNETVGVIVTDQRMPHLSGNELLVRVKELYPDVIRIVVTAYSDMDALMQAVNEGLVARYLLKPWERKELEEILNWAIEAYNLGRQNSSLQMRLLQTERLVTLGSIGAAVIHDINQPLTYLFSNSERLHTLAGAMPALKKLLDNHGQSIGEENDRRLLQGLAKELPELVSDMLEGCRLMQDLTGSIRRMLKPSSPPGQSTTDPLPVIKYALAVCKDIAMFARGTLMYDGPTEVPKVRMGGTELSQILINLVSNAAQALGRRGEPGGQVVVRVAVQDKNVRIVINDDGPGMSEEIIQKLGTPFFSTRQEGTGLGIFQCRRLIERENGKLEIQSKIGSGTTVSVNLERALE